MSSRKPAKTKYRVSLTKAQIAKILAMAKRETPLGTLGTSLIVALAPVLTKIENEGLVPAYKTEAGKMSDMEALTGVSEREPKAPHMELNRQLCYEQYREKPEYCTLTMRSVAIDYAVANDLATPEEIEEFESSFATTIEHPSGDKHENN